MAKQLVSNKPWVIVEPLLPKKPPKPQGGCPRVPDRAALTGILFILKTGIPWKALPYELGCGSGLSCWRRLRDWTQADVWHILHLLLLDRFGAADQLEGSRASLDAGSLRAERGGPATGPNPTDRGKTGAKDYVLVERNGAPLAVWQTAANDHDSTMFEPLLELMEPIQ